MSETAEKTAPKTTSTGLPTKAYAVHSPTDALAPWGFARRAPGPKDVVIEILYCGVCHSDIHQARGEWGNSMYPMVPGHEIVGRISQIGSDVKNYKVGDLAGIGCMTDSCRTCPSCGGGHEQFCDNGVSWTYNGLEQDKKTLTQGGYSSQITCDEAFVLKVSDKLPLNAVAPLLCAGVTTFSPLKEWKVGKGHKVAVLGLGGLGHMAVKFAASFGAEVTVLSTSAGKEADAKKLGATHFCLTKDAAQVAACTNQFDFIVNTVSAPINYDMYLGMLMTKGVMICVGIPTEPIKFASFSMLARNRVITGSSIGSIAETQEMLDYCAAHNIVSDVEMIDIKDINTAYERVLKSDVKYRFVIDMKTLK